MALWKYEGVGKNGRRETGSIQASSKQDARKLLRLKGVRTKKLMAPSVLEFDIADYLIDRGLSAPFGKKDLVVFTKQLSTIIDAGIPIIQGLEMLSLQQKKPALRNTLKKIALEVSEGKTIAESMATQKGFDKLYISMIKAGEIGGVLDQTLKKLSQHIENQEKVKNQIKSAMTYPTIVIIVGTGVIWALMIFVVPQFVEMLKSTGQEPPLVTKIVMNISTFLGNYTLYLLPVVLILLFSLLSWIKQPSGKAIFDRIIIRLPVLGGIVAKGNLASFTRTLATMLSSGVSLVDSLDICIETVGNNVVVNDLNLARKKVIEGKTLAEPLGKIAYFPPLVTQMVNIGEQTGQIDEMLNKCADLFEEEINQLIEIMGKMIEPLIMVVLGGIIAFVMVAMYLPIFMSAGGGA